jgi:hypothetical protein
VSVLGPPEFSTAAQVLFAAGIRVDIEHARAHGLDPLDVMLAQLAHYVWPTHLAANLDTDYPAEDARVDEWVRAGFCHGMIDVYRGRGPRAYRTGIADERARGYFAGLLSGRTGMTPS